MARMKWLTLAVIAALMVSVIAGCSASGGKTSEDNGKVTLEFIRWSNGPALDAEEEDKIKRFNDTHPNIQVKMTMLPWDETFKKIELSLASNSPVDIFYWDVPAYAWYKKGLFKNLQPYFDQDIDISQYESKLFEPFRFNGTDMFIAPENFQTLALYYNKDLFDKAGVEYPNENWTWDDVLEAAKKLTVKEGDQVTQYGFDLGGLGAWWGWMALSQEQGGKIADDIHEPEKLTLNIPETVNALRFLQDAIYKHGVVPDAAKKSSLGGDFLTGKIAMYVGGDWDLGTLKELKDVKWDMAPMPKWGDNRVVPYWMGGYVITEKSKHPDEAWEFVKWTMTENQETLAKQQSWIPVHNPSRENAGKPDWAPPGYETTRFEWLKYGMIGDVYHLKWREAHDKVITPITEQIFNNKISPEEALKQMDKQANDILAGK